MSFAHERLLIVACRPLDGALTPLQLLGVVVEAVGLPVERLAVRFKVEQAALAAVLVGALPLVRVIVSDPKVVESLLQRRDDVSAGRWLQFDIQILYQNIKNRRTSK